MVTRWDPSSRAGAVAVKPKSRYDLRSVHDVVMDWAEYQNLGGDLDNVETSPVVGTYDWRGYLKEEAKLAQERASKKSAKRQERAAPEPAPTAFYA